jgi:nucleoside-diphosphate-sugar epimerase
VWTTAYDQKRPYLALDDASRAIEHIIKRDLFDGRIYNVLTWNATVRQVVETIESCVGKLEIRFVDSQIMNQLSYEVSNARFRSTGFRPKADLRKTIADEIGWLRVNR